MLSKIIKIGVWLAMFVFFVANVEAAHEAHSFQHYIGPVKGDHQKIGWMDKNGHHRHDYVAEPHYKFSYGVEDSHTKDRHGHWEQREGKRVNGEYTIHEPGGNIRTVKYWSDENGFHANVHNSGPTRHRHW